MLENIYSGPSDSFSIVVKGYTDYAEDVIRGRAIPDLRDGLKPVTRRIIYSAEENKTNFLQKCVGIVSDALKLHPHGDQAVYDAFTLLTDINASCNMPFFKGMGNLGHVYSSDGAAAMRYPKAMIGKYAKYFFEEKNVMELVPAEEGIGKEPKVLNASLPIVLINGAMGIAVSAGTKMPSFNALDVIDLTTKYIANKKLEIDDMIIPDFPTGGVLVCNNSELAKIMLTGSGKLKIRAKVEIVGKEINVIEVPFGKTAEGIVKAIDSADISDISSCILTSGRGTSGHVSITCKTKKVVEQVLMELYRRNILQSTFGSNILVIEEDEPKLLGVYGVVKDWCSWRKGVLEKKFKKLLTDMQEEKVTLDYFIKLISNEEWRDKYTSAMLAGGNAKATECLKELFGSDIPKYACTWINDRKLSTFHKGGTYVARYETLLKSEKEYNLYLSDLDSYMIKNLNDIRKEIENEFPRKTEISYTDYKFSRISDSDEIEDDTPCVYTLFKDGFLSKTREIVVGDDILCQVRAKANSILIGFDMYGRVLRVIGKEIPYNAQSERGIYLPKYYDVPEGVEYQILYLGLLDGKRRMLVYRDGYIGFFDTEPYYGKKNIKITSKGMCLAVRDKLLHVYEEDDTPENLLLADETDGGIKLGIVYVPNVAIRSNLSRAKVLSSSSTIDVKYLKGFNGMEMYRFLSKTEDYVGKYKLYKGEFYDNPEDVVDGAYLEICKDIIPSEL